MTDPERISKRSRGLAAELLRAGADEQPSDVSVEQTLAALGVSGALLTTTTAAGATALGSAKVAGTAKAATLTLLAKWVSIGVVGGVGLAGAAAAVTTPQVAESAPSARVALPVVPPAAIPAPAPVSVENAPPAPPLAEEPAVGVAAPAAPSATPRATPGVTAAPPPAPELDVGAPLAAEVAYVDRARALVASGQTAQGLALLGNYEHDFPEARLLPEVLFLQLETLARAGRSSEARAAAQRLVDGFPRSPHASRARKLLNP